MDIINRAGFVYIFKCETGHCKIGWSKDPELRLEAISTATPFVVSIFHRIASDDARWLEKRLHRKFESKHFRGEWFLLSEDDLALLSTFDRIVKPPMIARSRRRKNCCSGWKRAASPVEKDPFGERLREYRNAATLKRCQLDELAGLSAGSVSSLEKGGHSPTLDTLWKLTRALGKDTLACWDR